MILSSEIQAGVPISYDTLSCTQLRVRLCNEQEVLCSGFLGSSGDRVFLITNWHCLSGRRCDNKTYIFGAGIVPVSVEFNYWQIDDNEQVPMFRKETRLLELFKEKKPLWLVHKELTHQIDVCALDLTSLCQLNSKDLFSIDCGQTLFSFSENGDPDYSEYLFPNVGEDIYILCSVKIPNGLDSNLIWKRASVASEPYFLADGKLPFLYIDSATRSGMSGSPVLYFGKNFIGSSGDRHHDLESMPRCWLAGVYSGRCGINTQTDNESSFQLGRVWRNDAVLQVLEAGIFDPTEP
jgi:hypothetical protein